MEDRDLLQRHADEQLQQIADLKSQLDNIKLANKKSQPLCQDTGTIICYAELPAWLDEATFKRTYEKAVVEATRIGYLRQNSVDSITGKNKEILKIRLKKTEEVVFGRSKGIEIEQPGQKNVIYKF